MHYYYLGENEQVFEKSSVIDLMVNTQEKFRYIMDQLKSEDNNLIGGVLKEFNKTQNRRVLLDFSEFIVPKLEFIIDKFTYQDIVYQAIITLHFFVHHKSLKETSIFQIVLSICSKTSNQRILLTCYSILLCINNQDSNLLLVLFQFYYQYELVFKQLCQGPTQESCKQYFSALGDYLKMIKQDPDRIETLIQKILPNLINCYQFQEIISLTFKGALCWIINLSTETRYLLIYTETISKIISLLDDFRYLKYTDFLIVPIDKLLNHNEFRISQYLFTYGLLDKFYKLIRNDFKRLESKVLFFQIILSNEQILVQVIQNQILLEEIFSYLRSNKQENSTDDFFLNMYLKKYQNKIKRNLSASKFFAFIYRIRDRYTYQVKCFLLYCQHAALDLLEMVLGEGFDRFREMDIEQLFCNFNYCFYLAILGFD